MSTIRLTFEEKIARIELNRAEKHNALTQSMWEDIITACDIVGSKKSVRVLIISGAGEKAFSAGADIEELRLIIEDSHRLTQNNKVVQLAQQKLESLPCTTIAQINGVCMGGGLGLALACDFRVCADNAQFAITPAKLGLLYSIEDTRRLVNIVGVARAKEMLYLGKPLNATIADQIGLVNQVTSQDSLIQICNELATEIKSVSGYSVTGMKKTIGYLTGSLKNDETHIRGLFDQAFTEADFIEGSQAFLQKRPAKF